MPIIAAMLNGPVPRRTLEHQVGADVAGSDDRHRELLFTHCFDPFTYAKVSVTEPIPLIVADARSPATTNDAVVYEPDITNWPASMPVP